MRKNRFDRYLLSHRRRWGLTQEELGFLLGLQSRTAVSRLEMSKRMPSVVTAFACQVVFGTVPAEIFSCIYEEVEADILGRAYDLYQQLQGKPGAETRLKLDLLEAMMARAKGRITRGV